jgi:hypothetical protein
MTLYRPSWFSLIELILFVNVYEIVGTCGYLPRDLIEYDGNEGVVWFDINGLEDTLGAVKYYEGRSRYVCLVATLEL